MDEAAANNSPEVVWLKENTLPNIDLGAICDLIFHISSLMWLQP
jgi:hypothetical protein